MTGIRIRVTLTRTEHDLARARASAKGVSLAEFMRQAIRAQLPPRSKGAWMQYAGFVESGNPHASQSVDDMVYFRAE
jgi:hypothetical protein